MHDTDRELLMRAARAAGIEHPGGSHSIYDDGRLWDCKALRWWNPLTDDGDALRLAVKLGIDVQQFFRSGTVEAWKPPHDSCVEDYGDDPYAATRRAIVRAAAALPEAAR